MSGLRPPEGKAQTQIRQFGTTTSELQALSQWLKALAVTPVALGIDRGVLASDLRDPGGGLPGFWLLTPNTCMRCARAQDRCERCPNGSGGLAAPRIAHKASLRAPAVAEGVAASWCATGATWWERRAQVVNELQKTLELANIKLAGVVSDITGVERPGDAAGDCCRAVGPESFKRVGAKGVCAKRRRLWDER